MENRAAVFASQPQAVEVYQSGAWWPGELLGWRHDDDGVCQVWVRVVLGGVEESAWTDLGTLRLPERHLASVAPVDSAPAPREAPVLREAPVTLEAPAVRAAPAVPVPRAQHDLAETASLPLVRDLAAAPNRSSGGTGGRRRAPETGSLAAESSSGPSSAGSSAPSPAARGRHRAPADPGRHRAADTGMLSAVPGGVGARVALPVPRTGRAEEKLAATTRDPWSTAIDPEPELLTRPMRLTDLAPHSRRPRVDGSLAGV
jgi:hypothetical protein